MALWFILALMTAAAIFAVLWPLGRKSVERGGSELSVYRAQLSEIESDRAAGRIAESEAQAARVEVSRRLLAAADAEAPTVTPADSPWLRRAVAVAALVLIPLGAGALYLTLGSPYAPDAGDANVQMERALQQLARIEAHLVENPDDGEGWQVVAPVYMRLGRFEDAVAARQQELRIFGSTPDRENNLGEALTALTGGNVTSEAKAAFARALALDPKDLTSRIFLGLAAQQEGKPKDAAVIWRGLLADAPADAPWLDAVRQALTRAENAPAGPTDKEIAAGGELSPEQRTAMAQGMVARLAERLKSEGSDVEGWLRLLRSYMVLGEREKAQAAAADARRALASEPEKLERVNELIKGLGLEG